MAMSKRMVAKSKTGQSFRLALLSGHAHNHEPRFKAERRKHGGWYRNLSDRRKRGLTSIC